MRSSTATRSEVAALSGDAGAEVPATRGDAGAGSAGGMARRGAGEGSARARFCKRRRCSAPLICCAERSSRLIQVRPRARAGPGRGQGGARAGPGRGRGGARAGLGPLSPLQERAACARGLAARHHRPRPDRPIADHRAAPSPDRPRRVQACRLHLQLLVELPRVSCVGELRGSWTR